MFELGRVCMKTAGREAGKYCVIVKKMEGGFFLVTGPKALTGVKRRKCNMVHLEPLVDKLKVKADATDAEVLEAYKEAKLLEKLGLKEVKIEKEHKTEKKEEHKPEHKDAEKKEEHKPEHKSEKNEEHKAVEKKARKPKKAATDK